MCIYYVYIMYILCIYIMYILCIYNVCICVYKNEIAVSAHFIPSPSDQQRCFNSLGHCPQSPPLIRLKHSLPPSAAVSASPHPSPSAVAVCPGPAPRGPCRGSEAKSTNGWRKSHPSTNGPPLKVSHSWIFSDIQTVGAWSHPRHRDTE